jgi:hypothetical protein
MCKNTRPLVPESNDNNTDLDRLSQTNRTLSLWCQKIPTGWLFLGRDSVIFKHRKGEEGEERRYLPKIIAPALRSFFTTPASSETIEPSRLKEPAVVFMPGQKI